MNKRELQKQETKKKIIEYARKLMDTKVFDEWNIRDICADLDISVGTFYYHFPTKYDLLPELYYYNEDQVTILLDEIDRMDMDYIERIIAYYEVSIDYIVTSNFDIAKKLFLAYFEIDSTYLTSVERKTAKRVIELLKKNQKADSEHDVIEIYEGILTICRGCTFNYFMTENYDIKGNLRRILRRYLNGLD